MEPLPSIRGLAATRKYSIVKSVYRNRRGSRKLDYTKVPRSFQGSGDFVRLERKSELRTLWDCVRRDVIRVVDFYRPAVFWMVALSVGKDLTLHLVKCASWRSVQELVVGVLGAVWLLPYRFNDNVFYLLVSPPLLLQLLLFSHTDQYSMMGVGDE